MLIMVIIYIYIIVYNSNLSNHLKHCIHYKIEQVCKYYNNRNQGGYSILHPLFYDWASTMMDIIRTNQTNNIRLHGDKIIQVICNAIRIENHTILYQLFYNAICLLLPSKNFKQDNSNIIKIYKELTDKIINVRTAAIVNKFHDEELSRASGKATTGSLRTELNVLTISK